MSDHDATAQAPSLTNGGIADLFINNPLAPHLNDDAPGDTTHLTSKTGVDETNHLTNGSSSLDVPASHDNHSEHSVKGDTHADDNFDEKIQKAMADVINDMQPSTGALADHSRASRQSNASHHHLLADDTNGQTTNFDPVSTGGDEALARSASEPILNDHPANHEPAATLPVRNDESSSDVDDHYGISAASPSTTNTNNDPFDGFNEQPKEPESAEPTTHDEFFDTKTATVDDDHRAASPAKSNILDETTRFTTTSPKSSPSRVPSSTSKRSVQATPDNLSSHEDEKKTSKSPEDAGAETDRENQEVTEIARRPSVARSPVNRPGSPTPAATPQDQERVPSPAVTHDQSQATNDLLRMSPVGNQAKSPSPVLMQRRSPTAEQPIETTQSTSRRESPVMTDEKPPSRLSAASKDQAGSKAASPTASRRSSDHVQEPVQTTVASPPSSPKLHQLVTANPILEDQARRSSTVKRASPTPSQESREKVLDGEPVPAPASRRESQIKGADAKSPSPQPPGSRRTSEVPETHHEEAPASRRASKVSQGPTGEHVAVTVEPPTPQVDETHTRERLGHSRQPSTASVNQVPSKRESVVSEKVPLVTDDGTTDEPKSGSKRSSVASEQKVPSRRESFHETATASSQRTSPVQDSSARDARKIVPHETKTPTPPPVTAHDEARQPSRRNSELVESQKDSRRASAADDHQEEVRRSSVQHEASAPSKRVSTVSDHLGFNPNAYESKPASRRTSTNEAPGVTSKRASFVGEQAPAADGHTGASQRESIHEEPQVSSKRGSDASDHQLGQQLDHSNGDQKGPSRRESAIEEPHVASKRNSAAVERVPSSRESSARDEPKIPTSKRQSTALPSHGGSRRGSNIDNQHDASQHPIVAAESHPPSKRQSTVSAHHHASADEEPVPVQKGDSRRDSAASDRAPAASKRGSLAVEHDQGAASRRESHRSDKPTVFSRQSSDDVQDQKASSKAPSRKHSFAERAPAASRRASDYDEKRSPSPHQLAVADTVPSKQSSRRSSNVQAQDETPKGSSRSRGDSVKDGHDLRQGRPLSGHVSNGSRYSSSNGLLINHRDTHGTSDSSHKEGQSSDMDSPNRRVSKSKHTRTPSTDQVDEKRVSPQKRASGQSSKRGSHVGTEETVVVPLSLESTRPRAKSFRSATESDAEAGQSSRLPPVGSHAYRNETSNKAALPASHNRKDYKALSASNASSPSEHGRKEHWISNIPIPSLDLSADDLSASRVEHERPKSPNVEQIAERNQPLSPLITSTAKTRDSTDIHKKKGDKRGSRREHSADESVTHIRIVDDKSLDSGSERDVDFDRHRGRRYKPKQREAATNTDDAYSSYAHQNLAGSYPNQRYYHDDGEYPPQKPLKATKPMPEHLHGARRRIASREQPMSTPDTARDGETPVVRRVVKHSKESTQNKEPVNVNVTVVVKKFGGSGRERSSNVTTEAYVDERSTSLSPPPRHQPAAVTHQEVTSAPPETQQQSARELPQEASEETTHEPVEEQPTTADEPERYFETVTPPPATDEQVVHEDEADESTVRPSSTDHARSASSKKVTLYEDRATQSDTEQSKPDTQKRRLRPKRISRTCQTYEHVFRRMEREQQQELRAVTDADKNVQTRKSQLRPRKKSPKKDPSVYLSTDSFRVEDLLPSHFHQSRRNVSKSSVVARSLSPQGGKLLILRPTLPFHHTDAVNVHRVCLQYAIDLIPSDHPSNGSPPTHRIKSSVHQQSDSLNSLPMIRSASPVTTSASTKSRKKEKSASHKSEEHHHHHHHRKQSGAH